MAISSKDRFKAIEQGMLAQDRIVRPSLNYWQDAWRRLKKNKLAMAGLIILVVITVMAIFMPFFSSYQYDIQNYDITNKSPNGQHWFGTDDFGGIELLRDFRHGASRASERVKTGWRFNEAIGFIRTFDYADGWTRTNVVVLTRHRPCQGACP